MERYLAKMEIPVDLDPNWTLIPVKRYLAKLDWAAKFPVFLEEFSGIWHFSRRFTVKPDLYTYFKFTF